MAGSAIRLLGSPLRSASSKTSIATNATIGTAVTRSLTSSIAAPRTGSFSGWASIGQPVIVPVVHARRAPQGRRVPHREAFDNWDEQLSTIPAPTQQALRTLAWVHRRETLVICGPTGTGKTFFFEALGQHAVEQGLKVAWFRLEELGALIRAHRVDDTAEGLYRLVDAAYEKRSIAISSKLHPSGFDELVPKTLATATVDRILHHAHVAQTSGESVRIAQALAGTWVIEPTRD